MRKKRAQLFLRRLRHATSLEEPFASYETVSIQRPCPYAVSCASNLARNVTRMLKPILTARDIAERYRRFLPDEIRQYLKDRGIPPTLIDRQLIGWNGSRITIPVFGRSSGEVLGLRYARSRDDVSGSPEMTSDEGARPELYGWETLAREPHRVVICEGEFERLVLEARGFPAVTSTGGADVFLEEWAEFYVPVSHVFICFNRSATSDAAARNVQRILPKARIAQLPSDVGDSGTITDFFVGLGRTELDFEIVLAGGREAVGVPAVHPPAVREFRPVHPSLQRRAERVRERVRLHEVAARFTRLQAAGSRLVGHCPLHDDGSASFTVYPETDTSSCSGCGAEGDVVMFLMNKESMTFGQALEALERFEITNQLHAS